MTIVAGKNASELEAIFNQQSELLRDPASNAQPFARTVQYVDVECDMTLTRVPLDAMAIGLRVKADAACPESLSDDFIFSLLLASGTTSSVFIEVPHDCTVDAARVLEEAESHGFQVRLTVPANAQSITPEVEAFVSKIQAYGSLWLSSAQSNIRLAPIDGYLEYLLGRAAGHQPQQITTDEDMQVFYTDSMSEEVMEYVKRHIDDLITEHVGGPDELRAYIEMVGKAMHLKSMQFRQARVSMLEEELDLRTPIPNMIRTVSAMTGLSIPDAAGMLYELKRGFHEVLDKYLPAELDEAQTEKLGTEVRLERSEKQVQFAKSITNAFSSAFGGDDALKAAWQAIQQATQWDVRVDVDRGITEPSAAAHRVAETVGVSPKVAALAAGELSTFVTTVFEIGGLVPPTDPEPTKVVKTVEPSGLIAVG